jgi:iron complex transport system substrate-binding protein
MAKLFNEVLGAEVSVPDRPLKIVSFSPAATETLFELGLGGRIAGVSAFCARPPEAKARRKVGSYNTVRQEVLDEIDPDLILTVTGYQRDFAVGLARRYPVYPLQLPVSVAGIIDFVVKVGLVAGAVDQGRAVAAALLRSISRLNAVGGVKSYVEIDLGGPVSFGRFSYITDAFSLLGSGCVYGDTPSEWLAPDFANVASADPDAIFYEPKMFSEFTGIQPLLSSRGWQDLRAVKLENVFVTPRPLDFLAHHGPSFITEVLPWLEGKLRQAKLRVES